MLDNSKIAGCGRLLTTKRAAYAVPQPAMISKETEMSVDSIADKIVCVYPSDEFVMTADIWDLVVAEWRSRRSRGIVEPLDLDDINDLLNRERRSTT